MSERGYLIFDIGASHGRAVVATFDGMRFALEVTHHFENRPVRASGTLYWDLLRLYSEICIGIQKSVAAHPGIGSLGIATWGVDFGLLDEKGRVLGNPVHYRDPRRNAIAEEVYRIIPKREVFRLTGAPMFSLASLYNLFAIRQDDPAQLDRARRLLMMPDLFDYLLTGVAVNEFTNATISNAYNQPRGCWEHEILDALDIPRHIFEPPVMPGTRIGAIGPEVCHELEVPPLSVIVPATHDTASAEAGIPVSVGSGTWAFLSLGTWGVVGMETPSPVINDMMMETEWGNQGSADGRSYLAVNVNGLWVTQQCRDKWSRDRGAEIPWEEIVRLALAAPRHVSFIDVDDPDFGPMHPDTPGLVAAYCARHGMPRPNGIGETARCVFESLAMKFRYRFIQLERLAGCRIECIHLVGGGAANEPLCQWTADAAGIPVIPGPVETTVVGNLIMQMKGTGEVGSLSEGRQMVARSSLTRRHTPRDTAPWNDAYARFERLLRS